MPHAPQNICVVQIPMEAPIVLAERKEYAPHTLNPSAYASLPEQLCKADLPWYNGHDGIVLAGGAVTSMVVRIAPLLLQGLGFVLDMPSMPSQPCPLFRYVLPC